MSDTASIPDVTVVRETEKALLVEIEGEQKWIPKSVVADESEVWSMANAGPGTLVVEEWFAEKEGIG